MTLCWVADILIFMIKPLEEAIGKILRLSDDKQELAAELLEQLAQSEGAPYALSPDERNAVQEALTSARRGEFAEDEAVDAVLRRPWG
jgi:hypothetical protein